MKCPSATVMMMKTTSNGVFQGENPLDFALPLVILQICLIVAVTRSFAFLLRPMRQPRVVAEIIGGIFLGPSALGRITAYKKSIFPTRSLTVLDTLANLGLLLFLFLVGLEIDLNSLRRTGKKAISIAAAGMLPSFAMGVVTSFAFPEASSSSSGENNKVVSFIIFMGVALSITAFGVLARILAELKLLTTDLGLISVSAAAITDVSAWVLLALAVSLSGRNSLLVPLWVLLSGIAFVIACFLVAPQIFKLISRRCPEGEPIDEKYVCVVLCAVLIAGFATDAIGIHAIFGAFEIGVLFPKGHFADAIVEKIEDLVMGLLLPLYFAMSGLKTDITTIHGLKSWGRLTLVIVTACFGKMAGTLGAALLSKVGLRDSLVLGVLMNTKGLAELIVLNIGKDRKVLSDETFAIMVLMATFSTFITTPIVMTFYKPSETTQTQDSDRHKNRKRRRKIENDEKDKTQQLKVLICLQSSRDINPMTKIIEASRGRNQTKESFCVYVMHLTQLSDRPSSIRMVQKARRNGLPFWNKKRDNSNAVVAAFEGSGNLRNVSVRSVTAISPLLTIHEDICSSADSKNAAFVILPFHRQWRSLEHEFETVRSDFQGINKRVLENSPCSVGILVDRGLSDNDSPVASSSFSLSVKVLFFGGGDDREALAYGMRMAEHPGVRLTVLVISGPEISKLDILEAQESYPSLLDKQFLAAIKNRAANTTRFEERIVNSTEETVKIIQESCGCDILLVGKSSERPLVSRLSVMKIEFPELGPVGNLILLNEISTSVSVLVVQQYTEKNPSVVGSVSVAVVETP